MGRAWTKAEDNVLYEVCGKAPIHAVAESLGRGQKAVDHRLRKLGISWRQGRYGVRDIAREAGCGITAARRAIRTLIHYPPVYSEGGGMRYAIDWDDAARVVAVLKRTQTSRVERLRKSEAGRAPRRRIHPVKCKQCGKSFLSVTGRAEVCGPDCKRKRNTGNKRRSRNAKTVR